MQSMSLCFKCHMESVLTDLKPYSNSYYFIIVKEKEVREPSPKRKAKKEQEKRKKKKRKKKKEKRKKKKEKGKKKKEKRKKKKEKRKKKKRKVNRQQQRYKTKTKTTPQLGDLVSSEFLREASQVFLQSCDDSLRVNLFILSNMKNKNKKPAKNNNKNKIE